VSHHRVNATNVRQVAYDAGGRPAHSRGDAGLSIACNKNALKLALQRAGITLFKYVREPLTASCFRDQFAADQKRDGIGSVSVAAALGHSSDKMQSKCGSASGAGGERIAAALTRDRLDWLTAINLLALEAMDRLPVHWRDACVRLQKELR